MDPTQCYHDLFHAMQKNDLATARQRAESLQRWLVGGGFYPTNTTQTEVDAYLDNVLRKTAHLAAKPKFSLGQTVITPNAQQTLHLADVQVGLCRHAAGDWGDCDPEDAAENNLSLEEGFRLLSVYSDRQKTKYWIITEADRSATTVLLPEDY